ncbi:MAG: hypothetical protein AAFY76_15195 [Cyanobacteria bacterium J06649_11]
MIDLPKLKLMNSQKINLTREQRQTIQEYCYLAALKSLSEQQQERMEEILKIASEDEVINFLIAEADHFIGHKLDIIDETECKNYQAALREYLLLDASVPDKIPS